MIHHRKAFLAIAGLLPARREARRLMAVALVPADGVDALSLRVSADSASLSLSYDGNRISSARIVEMMNRGLAVRGLRVSPLRAPG